jgi:hypothetical protein
MTAKSRRIDICSRCLDMRIRTADFDARDMTVILPQSCVDRKACEREMLKPFGDLTANPRAVGT